MNMAPRLLLVLFSLVPALTAGQKYLGGGSISSFYPYDLTDDENGDRGGRFVHHYDSKNDEHEDDDENTSNEAKPWRRRFNLLNTDLQILKNMKRSEKRHRLADSAEIALKRHHQAYDPLAETDEDDMENALLKNGFQASQPQLIRRRPQVTRRHPSPFTDYLLIDSLLKNEDHPDRSRRYWDRSCNCWRWAENLRVDRRRYSINMPLSILSWVVENAQKEEDMAKTRERLLGLGRK